MSDINTERQVRTVLESLQSQSPKQAMNLCEKYLKKNCQNVQLLSIKALILVYMGKDLEGLELAKELVSKKPTDLTTLGHLDKVFVTANDYKSSVVMFEEAFKSNPLEEVGSFWFFSVLRTQETKSLFSIALKLHSMFKDRKYLFWAVLALHLQSRSPSNKALSDGKIESDKAMKLAEKMLLKVFTPDKINSRSLEELLLLMMTLQNTENHSEALKILDLSNGIAFPNVDERDILRGDLLEKQGKWEEAFSFVHELIERKGIFDWSVWKLYIKAIEQSPQDQKDALVKSIPEFLQSIEAKTNQRSLLLAKIDAAIVFKFDQKVLVDYIIEYIEAFKDKGCCLADMHHTAQSLPTEVINNLIEHCSSFTIETASDLRENLIWASLLRVFQAKSDKSFDTLSVEKLSHLENILQNAGSDLELQATALFHLSLLYIDRNCDRNDLIKAVKYARKALNLSPDNFTIKLLLIVCYSRLGSVLLALDLFRSLEIKQLQLDTLSYLISDHILELGDFDHAELFFHESFFIYDENRTQSWGLIAEAFGRASYSNIPEFFEFARRLEYSVQAIACICGTIRIELMTRPLDQLTTYLEGLRPDELLFDDEFMLNLSDNRDRDIIDFIDQSESLRRNVFEKNPSFGRPSIFIFTFITILLRSLYFDDESQIRSLLSKFEPHCDRLNGHSQSAMETKRLVFVRSLVEVVEKYLNSDKKPEVFIDSLSSIFDSYKNSAMIIEEIELTYESLSGCQWELERDQWICLALVFLIKGCANRCPKSRRQIQAIATPLISKLGEISKKRSLSLNEVASHVSTINCPVEDCNDEWTLLCESWKHSLMSYRIICENTLSTLKSISN